MIDVQAELRCSGRCYVSLENDIQEVLFLLEKGGGIIVGVLDPKKRWISLNGEYLTLWQEGTTYRNSGMEYYYPTQYEIDRPWLILTDAKGWHQVEMYPMKNVAYLFTVEEVKNGKDVRR
jgi:hypothetical protein